MMGKDQILLPSLLMLLLSFMAVSSSSKRSWMVKPGCLEFCGLVQIPYPFGIGSGCALNESYTITCNSSIPYLGIHQISESSLVEVISVGLWDQTITIKSPVPQVCDTPQSTNSTSQPSLNLEGTPFLYSQEHNKLMLFGCGNALLSHKGGDDQVLSGCTSLCKSINSTNSTSACYGINCCETDIPFYLTRYDLDFTISDFRNTTCASAFLANKNWRPQKFSDPFVQKSLDYVPVILSWTLQSSDLQGISGCTQKSIALITKIGNSSQESIGCVCSAFDGAVSNYTVAYNPYVDGACNQVVLLFKSGKKNRTAAIVGATVGFGVLALLLTIYTLYKLLKKRRSKMRKEKFFKRNGGLLLQQQVSAKEEGAVEKSKIFTARELNKASDGFNTNRILGQGGQGTVYKGMLTDGRIVAIKKSKKIDENQLEQFINEVVILSEVNHRNVVKLLGCCLETEVPLLVYEFIPNGTLFSLIHNENDEDFTLTWNIRLRIAREIANALAYLHSAISIPIFHRDIKSSNVLLDEKYIAKVSDFGTSRSVAIDKTHLTTRVQGTFGYLDPEYFQSSQFTDKSDVYSFGVVLVELLTRQKPISAGTGEDGYLSLATRFLTAMEKNSLPTILDPQVVDQSNEEEVIKLAKLAEQCLNLNGKKRPTMKEVAFGLESIKMSSVQSKTQEISQIPSFLQGKSNVSSDTDYSWTTEIDTVRITSDHSPLLINTSDN